MLKQHREEAFDGAEQRAVDHHRTLVRAIGGDVFELETFRKVESSWMVDTCQVRPMASRACTEIFGP